MKTIFDKFDNREQCIGESLIHPDGTFTVKAETTLYPAPDKELISISQCYPEISNNNGSETEYTLKEERIFNSSAGNITLVTTVCFVGKSVNVPLFT